MDFWKNASIRRVPVGSSFSVDNRGRFWTLGEGSDGCEGTRSESRRKSLVGWCLFTATLKCSSFMVFLFFSKATCADFSVRTSRKSSVELAIRCRAYEFTLLMSWSSFMIFFTRPNGIWSWWTSPPAAVEFFSWSSPAICLPVSTLIVEEDKTTKLVFRASGFGGN